MKLTLQPVEFRHMNWLKTVRNNPEVMDFCRQPYLLNEIVQEDWFKRISKSNEMIPFIANDDELESGKGWVGYCAFSYIDPIARRAECSYFIAPEHRAKGYGQETVFLLLHYGFYRLGYQKIDTDTFDFNKEEIIFNKGMGFEESGKHIRHYFKRGQLIDSIIFYITKERFDLLYGDRIVDMKEAVSKPL